MIKKIKVDKKTNSGTENVLEVSNVSSTLENSLDKKCTKNIINKLDFVDLGRGDLNMLRDKINEIIENICQ